MPSSHRAPPLPDDRPGHSTRRWMALLPVFFAVVAVALLAAGVIPLHDSHADRGQVDDRAAATGPSALRPASASASPAPVVTTALTGVITLRAAPGTWAYPGLCKGTGRYAGLVAGAAVALFDQQNQQLEVTELRAGTATSTRACTFAFDLTPIRVASPAYTVWIGTDIRLPSTREQLVKGKYVFTFVLDA